MKDLQIFKNKEFGEIRTALINNEPYLCLVDVCKILELGQASRVKARLSLDGVTTSKVIDNLGREQQASFINESNLYKVIFQSRKPEAEKFTEWVTSEILPSIRKHGGYIQNQNNLSDDELMAKALILANKQIEERNKRVKELELQNKQNRQLIGELKAKSDYTDLILQSKNTLTVTAIAKDYGMSAIEFNKKLHELKIQYKQSGQWFLYEKYQKCGYTHSRTTEYVRNDGSVGSSLNTEWTQKRKIISIQ